MCCLLSLTAADRVSAQDRYVEIALRNGRARAYSEAVVLPGENGPQTFIQFRIPNSLLVFVQGRDGFVADVEVTVEVLQNGRTREERLWRRSHTAKSFDETQSKEADLTGYLKFQLPSGEYAYRLLLSDGAAGDIGTSMPKKFVVPFAEKVEGGFFVDRVDTSAGRINLVPTNLGGSVGLGNKALIALPVSGDPVEMKIGYRLYRIAPENEEHVAEAKDMYALRRQDVLVRGGSPQRMISLGDVLEAECLCWEAADSVRGHLALFDVDSELLEDGLYLVELTVNRGGSNAASQFAFRTHWRDMPFSLYDPEVAIRNLEFIAGKDEVRSMLRGSRQERIEKLRAFWKRRDPTPSTIANELMEEYYRRVDYAASEFRSGAVPYPDGLRTDPARVYIVHGRPARISHSLPPSGGVQQTWTYADGRTFVFRSASSLEPLVLETNRK